MQLRLSCYHYNIATNLSTELVIKSNLMFNDIFETLVSKCEINNKNISLVYDVHLQCDTVVFTEPRSIWIISRYIKTDTLCMEP